MGNAEQNRITKIVKTLGGKDYNNLGKGTVLNPGHMGVNSTPYQIWGF